MGMTGDPDDMRARLKMVLPARWFADVTPVLDTVLGGLAAAWSALYSLLVNLKSQTRIASASGVFLDMIALDYLGATLPRRPGEADNAYRQRIVAHLLNPRATRAALAQALRKLTGREPAIFEPLYPPDTGGYGIGTLAYNATGGYGCTSLPFQVFVTAFRPNATPVSNVGGYNGGPGGYNQSPLMYIAVSELSGAVSDAEIYAELAAVLPAASIAWTQISN